MNCRDFKNRLHEYLDETLGPEARADAGEHLRRCDDCRRALSREKAFAECMRHSFDRATAGLSIDPETRRNVLAACAARESKRARPSSWMRVWRILSGNPFRTIGSAAALLAVLLLFPGNPVHRLAQQFSGPQTTANGSGNIAVVDVPMQTQTRVFRRENNAVVDAIVPNATIGRAYFPNNSEGLSKRK